MRNGLVKESKNVKININISVDINLRDVFEIAFKLLNRNRKIRLKTEKIASV